MIRNSVLQSSRRRLVVQLAALVDLLFVILFLQYMQLRLISHRQAVSEKELRTQAEIAAKDAQGVTNQVVRNLEQLQNANRQLAEDLKNRGEADSADWRARARKSPGWPKRNSASWPRPPRTCSASTSDQP